MPTRLALAMGLAAGWLFAAPARAQPAVEVSATAEGCPLDDDLERRIHDAAVREALASAERATITVVVACDDPVAVHLVARAGASETARDLTLSPDERAALTDAIVLSALLALDELERIPAPPPPSEPEPVAAPPPVPPPAPPPPVVRAHAPPIEIVLDGGALSGVAPSVLAGVGLGAAYRWDDVFSVEVRGLGAIPGTSSVGAGRLQVASLALRAAVCADATIGILRLGGCLGAWGGALSIGSANFASAPRLDWAGWAAADGRLRATLVIDDAFVRLEAALLGVFVAPVLVVDAGAEPISAGRVGPLAEWVGLAVGVSIDP